MTLAALKIIQGVKDTDGCDGYNQRGAHVFPSNHQSRRCVQQQSRARELIDLLHDAFFR